MRRKHSLAMLLALGAVAMVACGDSSPDEPNTNFNLNVNHNQYLPNPPSQGEIDDARARVELAVAVAEHGRSALELLGLWPVYECGEPRGTFVGEVADGFALEHACASVSTSSGSEVDTVELSFPPAGCDVDGHQLSGDATLLYSGGTDRFDLEADLRTLEVDGVVLGCLVGYGTCGDSESYWVQGAGALPEYPDHTFEVDLTVSLLAGVPIFGSDTIVLDGSVSVTGASGADTVTCQALAFEVGSYLPKSGTLIVHTAGGTTLRVEFSENFLTGQAEVKIDDHDAVMIPLL